MIVTIFNNFLRGKLNLISVKGKFLIHKVVLHRSHVICNCATFKDLPYAGTFLDITKKTGHPCDKSQTNISWWE